MDNAAMTATLRGVQAQRAPESMAVLTDRMTKEAFNAAIEVPFNMPEPEFEEFQEMCPGTFLLKKVQSGATSQHSFCAASRHVAWKSQEPYVGFNVLGRKILILGASSREVRERYAFDGTVRQRADKSLEDTAEVHFHFHASEPKDVARMLDGGDFVVGQLKKDDPVTVALRKKASLYRAVGAAGAEDAAKKLRMVINGVGSPVPGGRVWIGDDLPTGVDVVVCRDVGYNFTEHTWTDIFKRTGASVAYVTLMIPDEIFHPDLPSHSRYDFHRTLNGKVAVTFPNCPATGYIHDPATWGLLLTRHYLQPPKGDGARVVQVEAVGRYGMSYSFRLFPVSLMKNAGAEVVKQPFGPPGDYAPLAAIRRIPLPKCLHYVRVLDIEGSVKAGRFDELRYFSVRAVEFARLAHHLMSVKEEGLRITYAFGYLNRMRPGVYFGGRTEIGKWQVSDVDAPKLALAAYAYAVARNREASKALETVKDHVSVLNQIIAKVRRTVHAITTLGLSELLLWLRQSGVAERLVLYPNMDVFKYESVKVLYDAPSGDTAWIDEAGAHDVAQASPQPQSPASCEVVVPDEPAVEGPSGHDDRIEPLCGRPHCEWCARMEGRLGRQRVTCAHREGSTFEFSLRGDRWVKAQTTLETALAENDGKVGLQKTIKRALDKAEALNASYGDVGGLTHVCEVRKILAPPGCGKTHCLKVCTYAADGIMMPLDELRKELAREGLRRCENPACDRSCCNCSMGVDIAKDNRLKTQHHAIYSMPHVDVLRIDEAMSMDAEMINLLVLATTPRVVELYGDARQYRCAELHGTDIVQFFGEAWHSFSEHRLHTNFRNPPWVVEWLRSIGYDIDAASDFKGPAIEVRCVSDGIRYRKEAGAASGAGLGPEEPLKPFYCLTLSGVGAAGYEKSDKRTVRCQQGRTLDEAIWFVTSDCMSHGGGAGQVRDAGVIVAMTRCRGTLTIVHDGSGPARDLLRQYGIDADNFCALMTEQTGQPTAIDCVGVEHPVAVEEVGQPVFRNDDDAYKHATELVPGVLSAHDAQPINIPQSQAILPSAARARINIEGLVAPLTSAGGVRPLSQTADVVSSGSRVYAEGDPSQTLNVATVRMGEKSKEMPVAYGPALAKDVAQHFFKHFMAAGRRPLPECVLQGIEQKALADHRAKGADLAVNGKYISEDDFRAVVRFHLKTINKVDTTKPYGDIDKAKVGQGISAWAKEPTLLFTVLARYIERWMIMHQRKDCRYVTTDDGVSDEEFATEVGTVAARIKAKFPAARWRTTDGVMFDSQQNDFTQLVEKELWLRIGIPQAIIDEYFNFRKRYIIKADGFTLQADHQKTSGEPWTKGGNGWVARALSAYLLDFEGDQLLIYKGDDFATLGVAKVNEPRLNALRNCTDLIIRMNEEPVVPDGKFMPDFCGMTLVGGVLYPSVVRRFHSLITKRFADAEQFALYQTSLRHFVAYIQSMTVGTALSPIAADAIRLGCPVELVEAAFGVLNSFCHVSKEQWEDIAHAHTLTPGWFGSDDAGRIFWVHANDEAPDARRRGDDELARAVRARARVEVAEGPHTPQGDASDDERATGERSLFERARGKAVGRLPRVGLPPGYAQALQRSATA